MNEFKLTALTPVHVGSGRELQTDFDLLYDQQEGVLGVIDESRVLNFIGEDGLEDWVEAVSQGRSLEKVISKRKGTCPVQGLSSHTIAVGKNEQFRKDRIREQVRNGSGRPFIPGSSLKGGMRTAFFTSKILETNRIRNTEFKNKKGKFDDKELQKILVGKDPNHDIFRAINFGDAHFPKTQAIHTKVLNQKDPKREDFEFKGPISQWVEGLPEQAVAVLQGGCREKAMKLAQEKRHFEKEVEELKPSLLFPMINQHTAWQIEKELEHWGKMDAGEIARPYLEKLENIQQQVEALEDKACIFRVGYGTGFLDNTGGWQKEVMETDLYDELKKDLRRGKYEKFPLPKSRRMAQDGSPMGFVKLEKISQEEYLKIEEEQAKEAKVQRSSDPGTENVEEKVFQPEYFRGKLRKGTVLDAYCTHKDEQNPSIKYFKLFIGQEGDEPVVTCKYPADLVLENYCQVTVASLDKSGYVENVAFKKLIR